MFEVTEVIVCCQNHIPRYNMDLGFFFFMPGVGTYLKSKNANVKVVLADPEVICHKVIFHLVPLIVQNH